jgi:hypothetical protein
MAIHKIFEGGNASNRTTNQMLPSGTTPPACNPPYSYADHQRERSYGVTRRIDLRAAVPYGKGGKDQSLVCYFRDHPVAANDELQTHLLLPSTLLLGVSYGIVNPMAGLTFSINLKNEATVIASAVDASVVRKNAAGCVLANYVPVAAGAGVMITDEDYLNMVLTAVPTAGVLPDCGGGGLNMWITAHVLDLDHGNA